MTSKRTPSSERWTGSTRCRPAPSPARHGPARSSTATSGCVATDVEHYAARRPGIARRVWRPCGSSGGTRSAAPAHRGARILRRRLPGRDGPRTRPVPSAQATHKHLQRSASGAGRSQAVVRAALDGVAVLPLAAVHNSAASQRHQFCQLLDRWRFFCHAPHRAIPCRDADDLLVRTRASPRQNARAA